ncbi:hypothetical protein AQJ66_24910 [Streptomyces bungoensis]|uniref:Uncharacterized protein n=1 Tax=Streptomyces bungoensis TaxID=285568 RepID=A0A117RB14_9ACTN|nr:hypothetical protein AQJ66_24910 [Streptomyces bungoensis]
MARRLDEEDGGCADDGGGLFESVGEILRRATEGDAVTAGPDGDSEFAGVDGSAAMSSPGNRSCAPLVMSGHSSRLDM